MPGVEHRSVTPILKSIRNFLRGRQTVSGLRYADIIAARTQPPPHVPGGPYHKLSEIYYYTRDARRLVQPPITITSEKLLGSGEGAVAQSKSVTPSKIYNPEDHN